MWFDCWLLQVHMKYNNHPFYLRCHANHRFLGIAKKGTIKQLMKYVICFVFLAYLISHVFKNQEEYAS